MKKDIYGYIYVITNKKNNKKYIGQTTKNFDTRYNYAGNGIERVYRWHLYKKKKGERYNSHLLFSIEKYGFDNWEIEKEFCIIYNHKYAKEELDFREEYYIALYNTNNSDFGYNKTTGGESRLQNEDIRKCIGDRYYPTEGEHVNAKKIVLLNTREVFDSVSTAKRKYGITSISNCLINNYKSSGTINTMRGVEQLVWVYYDEYIKMSEDEIKEKIIISPYIICLNTGRYFENCGQAGRYYNCNRSDIMKVCKGKRKHCGNFNNKPLRWAFFNFSHNKTYRVVY